MSVRRQEPRRPAGPGAVRPADVPAPGLPSQPSSTVPAATRRCAGPGARKWWPAGASAGPCAPRRAALRPPAAPPPRRRPAPRPGWRPLSGAAMPPERLHQPGALVGGGVQRRAQPAFQIGHRRSASSIPGTSPGLPGRPAVSSQPARARDAWLLTVPSEQPSTAEVCASDRSSRYRSTITARCPAAAWPAPGSARPGRRQPPPGRYRRADASALPAPRADAAACASGPPRR